MARIAVVGATGRVGGAICAHLGPRHEVFEIKRRPSESTDELAERAVSEVGLVINAAGQAHVKRTKAADSAQLDASNVDLPIALAAAALAQRIPMIHISSVKAVPDAPTPYGRSKFEGDRKLEVRFGAAFAVAELGLVIVRPLALLLPPFDAGKLSWLWFLRWWPRLLTPPIRLPVLAPAIFLHAVEVAIHDLVAGGQTGVTKRDFAAGKRATLRDVRDAMAGQTGA